MALPTYDKNNRRKTFEQLPKGAYVVRIKGAKEEDSSYGKRLAIAFDIAEGEYAGFYDKQFSGNDSEDKKWPYDAIFNLTIPSDDSESWVWVNWNSFFADLEDSNSGFVFSGDLKALKGKLIGGKFHIYQTEKNGTVYDHTKMKWTCVADDVRNGKPGKMPNDRLVSRSTAAGAAKPSSDGFMEVPDDSDEELPF